MVLAREDGDWKIKAIHWSSRQRRWGPLHRYTRCEGGLRRWFTSPRRPRRSWWRVYSP